MIFGCVSAPPEQQINDYFYKNANDPNLNSNIELARWIAYGYMNGVVYIDQSSGYRVFTNVEINKQKAIRIFEDLNKNGDKISQANLGIAYRTGNGVDKNLSKSIDLLRGVKDDYYDAAGEYGIAIHEMLKNNLIPVSKKDFYINEMSNSLEFSGENNYIPAHNALSQIYREGIYLSTDIRRSEIHIKKSKSLAEKKIKLAENIIESRMLISKYSTIYSQESAKFSTITMIIGFGAMGAMSFNPGYNSCVTGCNPPSVTDLLNWGVL